MILLELKNVRNPKFGNCLALCSSDHKASPLCVVLASIFIINNLYDHTVSRSISVHSLPICVHSLLTILPLSATATSDPYSPISTQRGRCLHNRTIGATISLLTSKRIVSLRSIVPHFTHLSFTHLFGVRQRCCIRSIRSLPLGR